MSAKLFNEQIPWVGLSRVKHAIDEILGKSVGFEQVGR